MKSILITGENSYVGNAFDEWIKKKYEKKMKTEKISLRNNEWKKKDFSRYDAIVHVSGIVHQTETKKNIETYYKVNSDLTYSVAEKAKKSGVSHFIFISTLSVYGKNIGHIDQSTIPNPKSAYGKSKYEGENRLKELNSSSFNVQIVRPPMIYGENCPGNYKSLSLLSKLSPIFFDYDNQRSMIYIDNLNEFLYKSIENQSNGIYVPQNNNYLSTKEIFSEVRHTAQKKLILIKIFNPIIKFCIPYSKVLQKIFGDLTFSLKDSTFEFNYTLIENKDSIKKTEKGT